MPLHRLLSLRQHALSDALLLTFGVFTPWLLGYSHHALATGYTLAMVGLGVVLNVFSQYPLGLVRVIPMRVHSLVEYLGFPGFCIGPWLLFPEVPRAAVTLTVLGLLNQATNVLTDYPRPTVAPHATR